MVAASSSSLLAPTSPAPLLRHGALCGGGGAGSFASSSSCRITASCGRHPLLRPPAWLPRRRPAAARPVWFCGNVGYEWPPVLTDSTKWGSGKGLCAAGTGDDAGDRVGEDQGEGDDGVRVSNEALRAAIRKSREVLAMHRNLLEQISEKKKLISVIEASSIPNEQDQFSDQSGSSFSCLDTVSEGKERGYNLQMYLDRRAQQSEVDTTHGEFISCQNDVTVSTNKDYLAQQSQICEKEHSVTEGINDNSSSSANVEVMNVILVAAECAPWSKTGGLGDVAGALPKALSKRGHRVMAQGRSQDRSMRGAK